MKTSLEQASFLRRMWSIITQRPTGPIARSTLLGFLPDRVYCAVTDDVSIDELVQNITLDNALQESIDLATNVLRRDWHKLRPESKRALLGLIEDFGLSDQLPEYVRLSSDDIEALTIRWAVADVLFFEAKTAALAECERNGLYLERREFSLAGFNTQWPDAIASIVAILAGLLRRKVETDLAVVILAAPGSRDKYYSEVSFRLSDEYLTLLVDARTALVDFVVDLGLLTAPRSETVWLQHNALGLVGGQFAEPFHTHYERLRADIKVVLPSAELFARARQLIGETIMQINYHVVGDGNVIDNKGTVVATVNKNVAAQLSRDVAEAFALLKAEVSQISAIQEKHKRRAISAIQEAEEETADEAPEADAIEESLKRAKTVLEQSGAVFDQAQGWGHRFVQLGQLLTPVLPAAWTWLKTLLG